MLLALSLFHITAAFNNKNMSGLLLLTEHSILLTSIIFLLFYLLGQTISGDLVLIVSDRISPLEPLDIFMQLKYQNLREDEKLNTTHKPSPSYVAGVPGFSLRLNESTNQIRIGGRAKFYFNILMRRIVSTLTVEVLFFYEKIYFVVNYELEPLARQCKLFCATVPSHLLHCVVVLLL